MYKSHKGFQHDTEEGANLHLLSINPKIEKFTKALKLSLQKRRKSMCLLSKKPRFQSLSNPLTIYLKLIYKIFKFLNYRIGIIQYSNIKSSYLKQIVQHSLKRKLKYQYLKKRLKICELLTKQTINSFLYMWSICVKV